MKKVVLCIMRVINALCMCTAVLSFIVGLNLAFIEPEDYDTTVNALLLMTALSCFYLIVSKPVIDSLEK